MRWLKALLIVIAILGVLWLAGRWVFAVPPTDGRPAETAIPFDPATRLGPRAIEAQSAHPGKSGVIPLPDGRSALLSRLHLAGGRRTVHRREVLHLARRRDRASAA